MCVSTTRTNCRVFGFLLFEASQQTVGLGLLGRYTVAPLLELRHLLVMAPAGLRLALLCLLLGPCPRPHGAPRGLQRVAACASLRVSARGAAALP